MEPEERPPIDRDFCRRDTVARVCRTILEDVVRGCRCDEATLWALSADGTRLEGALNHGAPNDVIESLSVPIDDSVIGMVAMTGHATSIGRDTPMNPSVIQAVGVEVSAMAAVPVFVHGETIGVLSMVNPRGREEFSAADVTEMQTRAYVLGLVLADQARSLEGAF